MSSRGGRSILGQTVRGHELVHDTCKEGDDNAKKYPAGKVYPWGVIDSAQKPKQNIVICNQGSAVQLEVVKVNKPDEP